MSAFPHHRPRRLRQNEALRGLVRETTLSVDDLIYPIFVEEGIDSPLPITAMPGITRIPETGLAAEVRAVAGEGIQAILLFGVSHKKDGIGSDSWNPNGLMARMIRTAKQAVPAMLVIADSCFCEYTDHGHCGVLDNGTVHNDLTLAQLAKQAVTAAQAGADIIAPSAMMDGQVHAIRTALDGAGFTNTIILSYAAKFASAFYGPFREAAGCSLKGDRKTYQMDPGNAAEALREVAQDLAEGADMVMVKPGLPYLDILRRVKDRFAVPTFTYQVSGEYTLIKAAAAQGWLDEKRVFLETLLSFKRAGADAIITYAAREVASWLRAGP